MQVIQESGIKVVVAVVVYDRVRNIQIWMNAWRQCNTAGAELVIIHNINTPSVTQDIRDICKGDALIIPRTNIGMDIGALQDVCRERLNGFPEFDYLLWCTDDAIPMDKDFVMKYLNVMQASGCGCAAMKISASVAPHVRTTGFMISKSVAQRLQFPVDRVITKGQNYLFEHRGGNQTMTMQIRGMGLRCDQVAPDNIAPMFDMGYHRRLNRMGEHNRLFYGTKAGDKVTFICTIYNTYPQVISSLLLQTHANWELILINDGKASDDLRRWMQGFNDSRIHFIETQVRRENYGHPNRQWALEAIRTGLLPDTNYIHIGNADNYYVPTFIEFMLQGFDRYGSAVATYCTEMVHSYKAWQIISCKLEQGYLDCAGVIVKKEAACAIGWPSMNHSSDWEYFEKIGEKYSFTNFIAIRGCLLVHN